MWLDLDLKLGGGQAAVHVSPELGPLCHPLHGAFLSGEDASDLVQLFLVPLQVPHTFSLQQAQLLMAVLVHGDVLAHVGVEAEVSVSGKEGVEHGVNLWREEER